MPDALLDHLARLRHDLGKYVTLQQRWLPPDASDDDLRAALVADLTRTRSGPGGDLDLLQVWEPLRPALIGEEPLTDGVRVDLRGDPWFDRLLADLEQLRTALPQLSSADHAALVAAAAAARSASDAAVALHRARKGEAVPPPSRRE